MSGLAYGAWVGLGGQATRKQATDGPKSNRASTTFRTGHQPGRSVPLGTAVIPKTVGPRKSRRLWSLAVATAQTGPSWPSRGPEWAKVGQKQAKITTKGAESVSGPRPPGPMHVLCQRTCRWDALGRVRHTVCGLPRAACGCRGAVLGLVLGPGPVQGAGGSETTTWPYLGLRGPKCNPMGTFLVCNAPVLVLPTPQNGPNEQLDPSSDLWLPFIPALGCLGPGSRVGMVRSGQVRSGQVRGLGNVKANCLPLRFQRG